MRAVPVDLLSRSISSIGGEPGLVTVGKVAVVVDAEAIDSSTLRDGSRVRSGQTDGLDLILNNVEVLPAGRGFGFRGKGDSTVGTTLDCKTVSIYLLVD